MMVATGRALVPYTPLITFPTFGAVRFWKQITPRWMQLNCPLAYEPRKGLGARTPTWYMLLSIYMLLGPCFTFR